ncbi:3695_t:CDS:2, partial [Dentiscutata heterogama]
KTNTEVFEILVNKYLNLDKDDFVEITKVDLNENKENTNLKTSLTNQLQEDIEWNPIEE